MHDNRIGHKQKTCLIISRSIRTIIGMMIGMVICIIIRIIIIKIISIHIFTLIFKKVRLNYIQIKMHKNTHNNHKMRNKHNKHNKHI